MSTTRPLHLDAKAILARLKQEGITALYHFSSVENLPSICQMGALCSKQMLEDVGRWPCPVPSGEGPSHSLDRSIGNWDKVPSNLTPHTPMAYHRKRAQHLCFFLIKPEVATWSGVLFTDSNAAGTTNQLRGEGLAGLNNIKFDVIRAIPRPWDRGGWIRPVQAEALVPDSIPFTYVSEIGFVSRASLDYTELLCDGLSHPTFSVIPQLFTDSWRASSRTIGYSYVHDLKVINTKNDESMVYLPYEKKNKLSKAICNHVMIVASTRVIGGIEARISLLDTVSSKERTVQVKQLLRSDDGKQDECSISLKDMPCGIYLVRYYLGDVCWASTGFEIVP